MNSNPAVRRHLVAATCATAAAAGMAFTNEQQQKHHQQSLASASLKDKAMSASNNVSFFISTFLLRPDPFVQTTLTEGASGLDFKAKKKMTKGMTLHERWEYFTLLSINPGEDDDDDEDDDEDDEDVSNIFFCFVVVNVVF